MDSMHPDDFKVSNPINLSKFPTRVNINATEGEKKEKLKKV